MKKFLTVLVIALIAMTSVFAATYNGNDLTLKLDIATDTKVGFTTEKVTNTATDLATKAFANNELNVADSTTVWASCITKSSTPVTIAVTVTDLTSGDNTIGVTFADGSQALSVSEGEDFAKEKRAISVDASIVLDDYSNSVAGTYTGTMTLTVTAD